VGKTATELREEIEERREDLGRDFEAIGDRVSPARIAERKTEAMKSKLRGVKEAVMGTADDVTGGAHDTIEGVRESAHDLAGTASDKVHAMTETAGAVPATIRHQTQGNPLAAGLVAFGLGLLAASLLPASRRERQLARRVEPQLQDAARTIADTGRGMAEELKPVVQEHAEALRDSATEAAHHVADQAKDAALTTADQAQQSAAQVKATATR
jgi:gas vesicle protein